MTETTPEIALLADALAKAQGAMGGAVKDSTNPFYKSKYADLESVWSACRKALSDNGLAVIQTVTTDDVKTYVTTILAHSSGQWIRETLPLPPKEMSPQGIGSCISYGRRYALAAIVGVYQTDDDAEAGEGRQKEHDPDALVGMGKHAKKTWRVMAYDALNWYVDNPCHPTLKAGAQAEISRRLEENAKGIDDEIPYESVSTS